MSQRFAPNLVRVFAIVLVSAVTPFLAHARTRPHYGGTLRIEVESDPMQKTGGIARRLIFDGLTRTDAQGSVRPALAMRWSSENSGHRWQFWLRTGVTFHNSHPLNGQAVVASLDETCRTIPCPWTAIRNLGQSVVFTSDNPIPDLPSLLASSQFLIQQTSWVEGSATPVVAGTGPFRVKDQNASALHLEANDDCWQGRPFLDSIEMDTIDPHRSTRDQWRDQWMDIALGKTDLIEVHPADIRQATQQRLNLVTSRAVTLLALEVHNPDLTPQIRASIALAVDRAALYQVIFQKQGELTASLLPASLSGYSFLFPTDRDLAHAQALRGGLNPPPLTLAVDGTGAMQLAAERLALNLHDAGFTVRVIPLAANGNLPPRADLVLRSISSPAAAPAETLDAFLRSFNPSASLIQPSGQGPTAIYKAERDFLDRHSVIPLLYLPRAWAVSARVRDLSLTAEGVPDLANLSLASHTNETAP